MKRQCGFSLIELLIVVAIILIIAAIAIPNMLRARISANEASAVGSIRTVNTAEISYAIAYPTNGFASNLTQLGPTSQGVCTKPAAAHACLIDWSVSNATVAASAKSGYYFRLRAGASGKSNSYEIAGAPAVFNRTGVRNFCSIEDGVVRYNNKGSAALINAANCPTSSALGK
jgi:prepilin-type N-terminal cleavage/methylation domain-containing protein